MLFFLSIILTRGMAAYGQRLETSNLALKTNFLSAIASNSLNAAVEILVYKSIYRQGEVVTLNLPISYNPFTFSDNRKLKHISFQPELRFWKPMPFENFFIGVQAHYAYYNVSRLNLPFGIAGDLKERRYQGQLYGTGLSAGYDFVLGNHFSLETTFAAGYAYMDHTIYRCETCGTKIKEEKKHYFGPTKAGISLVYIIK